MPSLSEKAVKTTFISIAGNACFALVKGVAGYFGNSQALMADAIESTSDIFSSIIVWFGLKYSSRPADENHPYGHGRAEPLVAFIAVMFLIVSAILIAYSSIIHLRSPQPRPASYTLIVLGVIIIAKELFYRGIKKKNKEIRSTSLRAEAWHHRSDAITSFTAFVGISISLIGGKGYESADDWAALFTSAIILFNSFLIFRPALGEIMDEHLYDDMVAEIRKVASDVSGVIATEKCYVRKTGLNYYIDLHITVRHNISVLEGHDIAHALKKHLQSVIPQIADVLIHVEPDT